MTKTRTPSRKKRLDTRVWEITLSPGAWPLGSRLTTIDVSATLRLGYFDVGMRIKDRRTRSVYTVKIVNGKQVLRNSRYCVVPYHSGLKRVTYTELMELQHR